MNNLNDFSKEQLIGLLQKANKRRKRESKKWKSEVGLYRRAFIRERNAQARTCANFRKYMDDVEGRTKEKSLSVPTEKPMYVIRVNSAYLYRLYIQQEADTDELKAAVFDRVIKNITEYLHTRPKDNIRFGVHFDGDSWEQNTWSFELSVDAGGEPSLAVILDVMKNELRRVKLNIKE